MVIQAGALAPDFKLMDEEGVLRSLSDYCGKTIVLYFYPKDDTPGCTTEACNFRDGFSAYKALGVEILGVSPDTTAAHGKFKSKYTLPFTLLADENHEVCELYGVWGPKKFMGKAYDGVYRTTFLIGPDGTILKVFENVKPDVHNSEVLAALQS